MQNSIQAPQTNGSADICRARIVQSKSRSLARDSFAATGWHDTFLHRILTHGDIGRNLGGWWLLVAVPLVMGLAGLVVGLALQSVGIPFWQTFYASISSDWKGGLSAWQWHIILALLPPCLDVLLIYLIRTTRRTSGASMTQFLVMQLPRALVWSGAVVCIAVNYTLHSFFDPGQELGDIRRGVVTILTGMHVLQLLGSLLYLRGMFFETGRLLHIKENLVSDKLRAHLSLVHLSDLHIENKTVREDDWLLAIQKDPPDIICLTGDYLNLSNVNHLPSQQLLVELLQALPAESLKLAVPGSPTVDPRYQTQRLLEEAGCVVLRDELLLIEVDGQTIQVLGLDCDHEATRDDSMLLDRARLIDPDVFCLLLFHSPEVMPLARTLPIDLYLCGHTHGGQVRLPLIGPLLTASRTGRAYVKGRYLESETTLYVSPGVGLEGQAAPRMRLLCQPEMIRWQLAPKKS